jgi:hypothetical protein
VDQVASQVRWDRSGRFGQHIVATRSATTTLPLSRIRYLLLGWITPITTGDRLPVFGRQLGQARQFTWPPEDTASAYARHPLGADRERYYRFVSADTVPWTDPGGGRHVAVRLEVRARDAVAEEHSLVFDGELWLEREGLALMRVRGRLVNYNAPPLAGINKFIRAPDRSFLDLQHAPVDGVWLPALQRFEWVQSTAFTELPTSGLRILTRFRDVHVTPAPPEGTDVPPHYALDAAAGETLDEHDRLFAPMGREASRYELTDFDDIRLGEPGTPRGRSLGIEQTFPGEMFRLNRIEGVFAGVAASFRVTHSASAARLHAGVGYGVADQQVRGNVAASWQVGPIWMRGFAGRFLANTNEFMAQFATPTLAAFLSRDNWDYVDRREAGLEAGWLPTRGHGSMVGVAVSMVRDDSVTRAVETTPWVGFMRNNRGIREGDYLRVRAALSVRPDIGISFVRDGIGGALEGELGTGSGFAYQRLVGRVLARKNLPFMYLTGQLHAGKVWGDELPPQQLLEVGGAVGLPGYDYKYWAGDVAALARVRASFPLPLFRQPIPVGQGFALPSLGPQFSVGFQAAWTDVTTPAAERAMAGLGPYFDTKTGQEVPGVPASRATDGAAVSLDVRLTLFNDALGIGLAVPVGFDKGPTVMFVWGQQF